MPFLVLCLEFYTTQNLASLCGHHRLVCPTIKAAKPVFGDREQVINTCSIVYNDNSLMLELPEPNFCERGRGEVVREGWGYPLWNRSVTSSLLVLATPPKFYSSAGLEILVVVFTSLHHILRHPAGREVCMEVRVHDPWVGLEDQIHMGQGVIHISIGGLDIPGRAQVLHDCQQYIPADKLRVARR